MSTILTKPSEPHTNRLFSANWMLFGKVFVASSQILLSIEPLIKSHTMTMSSPPEVIILELLTTSIVSTLPKCAINLL
jgi:hypothetical protein